MKKIALVIAVMIAAPAFAWNNADSQNLEFGGKITPEEYTSLWRWKVGTGLNDFNHNISDMDSEMKKLTISMDKPKGLLYGETIKAMTTGGNNGLGAAPNIAFSDYENNPVKLNQESGDETGRGHLLLPIKNKDSQKIGSLKLNVTTAGMGVSPGDISYLNKYLIFSASASAEHDALYGGLVARPIASGHNGSWSARTVLAKFGAKGSNELREQLLDHPIVQANGWDLSSPMNIAWAGTLLNNGMSSEKVVAASYVMGIDQGQTLEATFNNPISSTTEWTAPLNISVTYN